jgi:hypothetical protein
VSDLGTGYNHLRSCAGCSAHLLTYASRERDEAVFCNKCQPGLLTPEEQAHQGNRVKFWGEREGQEWIVIEEPDNAGYFHAKELGRPTDEPVLRHVNGIKPEFSYTKLNRVRAEQRRAGTRRG